MHYYCIACETRMEGKLEVQDTLQCVTCGRYYTMAELIALDIEYLNSLLSIWSKNERRIIENSR